MTTAVVRELLSSGATLEQFFLVKKRIHVKDLRLRLWKSQTPSGTFTMKIKDDGGNQVLTKNFTAANINTQWSTANNSYAYGGYNFGLTTQAVLLENKTYSIELSSSGYTYAAGNFLGWVKSHEFHENEFKDVIPSFLDYPMSFLIWGFSQ